MHRFKAYRTFQDYKGVSSRFVEMTEEELDPGDVLVRTKYSTINYKDALSYNGAGRIMRKFPTVGGIDMAGTVEGSGDPRFRRGDKVIVHAYDFGVAHDGGYAEYTRVPADWVVRRPKAMTAFDAMKQRSLQCPSVIPPRSAPPPGSTSSRPIPTRAGPSTAN